MPYLNLKRKKKFNEFYNFLNCYILSLILYIYNIRFILYLQKNSAIYRNFILNL